MADARFPIIKAPEELGIVPVVATRAPAGMRTDTAAGATGAVLGQTVLDILEQVGEKRQQQSATRKAIEAKRRQMMDANSAVLADTLRRTADAQFETVKLTSPQETWQAQQLQLAENVAAEVGQLDFSPDALVAQRIKSAAYTSVKTAQALTDATRQLRTDTIEAQTQAMVDAFRTGGAREQLEAVTRYRDNGSNMGKDKVEVLNDIKAARTAGQKLRTEDLINEVHAAIEAASATNGDYTIAKELATNSAIPEIKQTSLRTAINTAETARNVSIREARENLVNQTTSDTIREYFAGSLTVAALNQRHEGFLVKDSEFKFMMKGLTDTIPEHSDPFAKATISRAYTDFHMGAINRAEADNVIAENYSKLDGPDRTEVVTNLEDIEAKIIATAKSNAYSEGRGLMSQRFVGIQSEEDLIDLFRGSGLSDAEKARINKSWTAEVNNRDLYERAVDDRFKEMRKEGVSDIAKYRAESLKILLQYQQRKRLSIEPFEAEITREQQRILGTLLPVGPPAPIARPIEEMSTKEKQAELQRIRELKQLQQ